MIEINNKEVYTTLPSEKRVHRIDTDVYFSRCTRLNGDTLDMFEEVNIEDAPQLEIPDDFEEIDTPTEWSDEHKEQWEDEHPQDEIEDISAEETL